MAKEMREPIETGCPDPFQYMHPVMRRNFGMWAYHAPASWRPDARRQER